MNDLSIWTILGIDETKDLDKLKNAYRAKLSENNPEDNPEGFKVLRASYEEAVRETYRLNGWGTPKKIYRRY